MPFLIVEPLLVVATVAIAMGYVLSGAIAWIVLKFLAVALIPAIFDLTKHKLMTMPWFVRAYEKVMAFHDYADQIVAPYKHAAAAVLRQWRMRSGYSDHDASPASRILRRASPPASAQTGDWYTVRRVGRRARPQRKRLHQATPHDFAQTLTRYWGGVALAVSTWSFRSRRPLCRALSSISPCQPDRPKPA